VDVKKVRKRIALERVERLFELAEQMLHEDANLSQRYVELARKIAMRERVKMPKEFKRMVCKHCKKFIYPNISCRVRIRPRREPHVVITCLFCNGKMRIPISKD
jgi:ribonuclease P protein subunit RPR2